MPWVALAILLLTSLIPAVGQAAIVRTGEGGCLHISSGTPPAVQLNPSCKPASSSSSDALTLDPVSDGLDVTLTWTGNASALSNVDRFVVLRGVDAGNAQGIATVDADEAWRWVDEAGTLTGETWYGVVALDGDGDVLAYDGQHAKLYVGT